MTIVFHNDSLLPIECISTFGVNAKETDNPIGYFGTGLKYAIAVLLRNGCKIGIQLRQSDYCDEYHFHANRSTIRGKEFDIVHMDDKPLGFTTELGKNWGLQQAYRELYSNCKDEGGEVFSDSEGRPDAEGTTIFVDGIDEVHDSRSDFILLSRPKHTVGSVEIHESDRPGIFYRGIKVLDLGTKFTYNILSKIELTEDRTAYQYEVDGDIIRALVQSSNIEAISDILAIDPESDFHELQFPYSKYTPPSSAFMKLVSVMKNKPAALNMYYRHHAPNFLATLDRATLSQKVINRLARLRMLLPFKPKEVNIIMLEGEDFRIVGDSVCQNSALLKNNKRLTFAYLLACYTMQPKNKSKSPYNIIAEDMLRYFSMPKPKRGAK